MTVIVNPGSGAIPERGNGWENTPEQARRNAETWLRNMRSEGIPDVDLLDHMEARDGRWEFYFRHRVTGVVVTLETHGLTDEGCAAYKLERIFGPRVYWHGSSSEEPSVEQWGAPGFEVVKTLRPVRSGSDG